MNKLKGINEIFTIITQDEFRYLERHWDLLSQLAAEKISPTTEEQKHFIEVQQKKQPPKYPREFLWLKVQTAIRHTKQLSKSEDKIKNLEETIKRLRKSTGYSTPSTTEPSTTDPEINLISMKEKIKELKKEIKFKDKIILRKDEEIKTLASEVKWQSSLIEKLQAIASKYEPIEESPTPEKQKYSTCKQCLGDGGAGGRCPRCSGNGFEP